MHPILDWSDLILRLVATLGAGAAFGLNRGGHGKAAGLRTTILVCLAASLAMLLANLLLTTTGKTPASYVQMDVMRLPLGILTGMGFIGGGAILRRETLVVGVTTAATLWLVTMVGLCIGAGQIGLGLLATALGLLVLSGLGIAEQHLPQVQRSTLVLSSTEAAPIPDGLLARIQNEGYQIAVHGVSLTDRGRCCETRIEMRRVKSPAAAESPKFLSEVATYPEILAVRWYPAR